MADKSVRDGVCSDQRGRNVILLTADSFRADHCGFLNDSNNTTPFLDKVSEEGVTFENAIATGPRTPSSAPEFITGSPLPKFNKNIVGIDSEAHLLLDHIDRSETIAERFRKRGYSTVAFTANPWTTKNTYFDKGFDKFVEIGAKNRGRKSGSFSIDTLEAASTLLSQWWNKTEWFSQWPTFYEDILTAIESVNEPYFLWVFLLDTHNPYIVPREDHSETSLPRMYYSLLRSNTVFGDRGSSSYRNTIPPHVEREVKKVYRDGIRSVDRFVQTIADDLAKDDPVIIFHSDHGEAFNEHGTYGHQRVLYEENIHVPLVAFNTAAQERITGPFSLLRFPELITTLSKDGDINPKDWTDDYTISRTDSNTAITVRTDRWKYLSNEGETMLYDLVNDPHEKTDIAEENHGQAKHFQSIIDDFTKNLSEIDDNRGEEIADKKMRNRLESLGYR